MSEIAKKLKDEGNVAFREKRYNAAVQKYTLSLQENLDPLVLGNRAQAHLNLKCWTRAVMDCDRALSLDNNIAKALFRRSLALEGLGLMARARSDAERCRQLSDDVATRALLERLQNKKDVEAISLECCEKGDELRTDSAMVDVLIECDDLPAETTTAMNEETTSKDSSEAECPTAVSIPNPPSTFLQFTAHFAELRKSPRAFAVYFLSIATSDYQRLLDDLIEIEVVSCLLDGLAKLLSSSTPFVQLHLVVPCLLRLATVSRFDMAVMFMGSSDKTNLHKICDHLPRLDAATILEKFT